MTIPSTGDWPLSHAVTGSRRSLRLHLGAPTCAAALPGLAAVLPRRRSPPQARRLAATRSIHPAISWVIEPLVPVWWGRNLARIRPPRSLNFRRRVLPRFPPALPAPKPTVELVIGRDWRPAKSPSSADLAASRRRGVDLRGARSSGHSRGGPWSAGSMLGCGCGRLAAGGCVLCALGGQTHGKQAGNVTESSPNVRGSKQLRRPDSPYIGWPGHQKTNVL